MLASWYRRPVAVLCVLLAWCALTLALLTRVEWGQAKPGAASWDVIIEHFGVDSEEIERSITDPLEAELARLQKVSALRSVSEFGKTRVTVSLTDRVDTGVFSLELRDAVDRVEARLPPSAQRPRILVSGGLSPAFIAALETKGPPGEFRDWVERSVKPALEKQPGVGEVEIGGGKTPEIHVLVDEGRAAAAGISFEQLVRALQAQNALLPAGTLRGGVDRAVSVSGRMDDLNAIGSAAVGTPGGFIPIRSLAGVVEAEREPDTISRLDGDEKVVLLVHAAGTANLVAFSRQMRSVLDDLRSQGIGSRVILDEGKILDDALGETFRALAEGLAVILAVLPLVVSSLRALAALALILPLSLATAAAVTGLTGTTMDRFVLAGFAVGIGMVLDFALLVSRTRPEQLPDLVRSLTASLLTILMLLVPLVFLDFVWPGIRTLVAAVGTLLAAGFLLTVLFLPVLGGSVTGPSASSGIRTGLVRRWSRWYGRLIQAAFSLASRRAGLIVTFSLIVTFAVTAAAIVSGTRLVSGGEAAELAVHLEFESEASLRSADERAQRLSFEIGQLPDVRSVQSLARPGCADLTVMLRSAARRAAVSASVLKLSRDVPGAAAYLPEPESGAVAFEVTLTGDDNETLRALAKRASASLSQAGFGQVVLHFKEPPRRLAAVLDQGKLDQAALSAAGVSGELRWNVWGPVAFKWIQEGRERDVRVMGQRGKKLSRSSLLELPLAGSKSEVRLAQVARLEEQTGGARIYHENRRRAVSLSVQAAAGTVSGIVGAIDGALRPLDWPKGYVYQIDRKLADEEEKSRAAGGALGLGLVFVGLLFGARTQRWQAPFLILAMISTALAVPLAAVLFSGGVTVPALLALVLSGGIAVNNAVLVADAVGGGGSLRSALRKRLPALALTDFAALLGAIPLALAGHGGLLSTLALLVAATAVSTFLSTLTAIPALLTLFPNALKSKPLRA